MAKKSDFPDNIEDYWKEREKKQRQYNIEHDAQIDEEIERIYKQMADNIQQEIDSFYAKYARDSKISLSEAKKRVSKLDIAAYERKAEQYVKDKDFSDKANEEMKLYNATMKINRLEMLKSRIGMAIANSTDDLDKLGQDDLIDETYQEQLRMAGILGYSVRKNEKYSRIIAESSFHNATFSDRIWGNSSNLKSELERQLMTSLIQGRNHMVLSRDMAKRMNVSLYNAKRLLHTELKRCRTEAQKQSYVNGGYDQYKFLALGNACEICRELNGKIFDVKDMEPGGNAPPMHPNCRCSTAPAMDEKLYNEWLDGFQEHGLSFEDWSRSKVNEKGNSYRIGTNKVDLNYIRSKDYGIKFNRLTGNTKVNNAIRRYAIAALTHRKETDGEDLYIIDSETGDLLLRKTSSNNALEVGVKYEEIKKIIDDKRKIIGLHNHPTNILPTGSDFTAAGYRKYLFGVVVTHDGRVFKYSSGEKPFLSLLLDNRIEKYQQKNYTLTEEQAHIKALNELKEEYGIAWEEIKN